MSERGGSLYQLSGYLRENGIEGERLLQLDNPRLRELAREYLRYIGYQQKLRVPVMALRHLISSRRFSIVLPVLIIQLVSFMYASMHPAAITIALLVVILSLGLGLCMLIYDAQQGPVPLAEPPPEVEIRIIQPSTVARRFLRRRLIRLAFAQDMPAEATADLLQLPAARQPADGTIYDFTRRFVRDSDEAWRDLSSSDVWDCRRRGVSDSEFSFAVRIVALEFLSELLRDDEVMSASRLPSAELTTGRLRGGCVSWSSATARRQLQKLLQDHEIDAGRILVLPDPGLNQLGRDLLQELEFIMDSIHLRWTARLLTIPFVSGLLLGGLLSPALGYGALACGGLVFAAGFIWNLVRWRYNRAGVPLEQMLKLTPLLLEHARRKLLTLCYTMEHFDNAPPEAKPARIVSALKDERPLRIRILSRFLHEMYLVEHDQAPVPPHFDGVANTPYGLAATLVVLQLLCELLRSDEVHAGAGIPTVDLATRRVAERLRRGQPDTQDG